jgi:hypothetical protein
MKSSSLSRPASIDSSPRRGFFANFSAKATDLSVVNSPWLIKPPLARCPPTHPPQGKRNGWLGFFSHFECGGRSRWSCSEVDLLDQGAKLLRSRRVCWIFEIFKILYLCLGFEEAELVDEEHGKTGKSEGFIQSCIHDSSHSEMVFLSQC